jgi:hypothetical protein
MGVEVAPHQVENVYDEGVANGIENLIGRLAIHQNVLRPQHCEVLRDVRLFHPEPFNQHTGRQLPVSQLFHDCDTGWMSESLEKIGLEPAECILHRYLLYYNIRNFEYTEVANSGWSLAR